MRYLRERVLAGELLAGTFCNLGSHITTEIAGNAGFDWLLLDLEHGAGDQSELVHQLQAAAAADTPAIVRIAWNEPWRFKRVLDTGAAGVMVPWVSTVEEAQAATTAMRYFPDGVRGAATLIRANGFGRDRDEYLQSANDNLLTVVQIETRQAVENGAAIAAVEGVDVLFGGRSTSPSASALAASSTIRSSWLYERLGLYGDYRVRWPVAGAKALPTRSAA